MGWGQQGLYSGSRWSEDAGYCAKMELLARSDVQWSLSASARYSSQPRAQILEIQKKRSPHGEIQEKEIDEIFKREELKKKSNKKRPLWDHLGIESQEAGPIIVAMQAIF
ncbi:hypothetical protein MRB53_005956 [Persea americana]|uniref:Uncharacterized protein n=1 Tax=Persea americana TaxID=3435 RepID=A0ACC2MFB0_PERAE|nr:hypothetical protein MRB53_005956 [Persea americana]